LIRLSLTSQLPPSTRRQASGARDPRDKDDVLALVSTLKKDIVEKP
jgi:hypothetical protein